MQGFEVAERRDDTSLLNGRSGVSAERRKLNFHSAAFFRIAATKQKAFGSRGRSPHQKRLFWFWFTDFIATKERKEHRDNFFAVFVFYCG